MIERKHSLSEGTVNQESEHKPTKFAYLGVGQAVLPQEIAGFAIELFPSYAESIPSVLTQAQEIANVTHHRPNFNLTTDLFHADSPSFQRTDFVQLATLELCAEAFDLADLEQNGLPIIPDFFAGHSLGSIFAAYLSGAIPQRDSLRKIGVLRGKVMQEAYEKTHTTLVSIQGLSEEALVDLLPPYAKIGLINAPTLIAVGLPERRVEELHELVKKAGARKVVSLGTKGAFHVRMYMEEAAEEMGKFLRPYDFVDIQLGEFVANSDGRKLTRGEDIKEELVASMIVPVQYPAMLKSMVGVDGFIEIGPGKVLTGLNNLNDIPKTHSFHIRNYFRH